MSMEDILKVLVESRQPGTPSQQTGADPMTQLIGSLMAGGPTQVAGQSQSGGQPQLGGPSGGLGDMMGMLETVLGGQNQGSPYVTGQTNPIMSLLTPFVAPLAKKANIPPEIAMIVVSFVVHKLLAHHPTSGRDSNTFDLDNLLGQMNTGKIDPGLLQSSGMVRELSTRTGLDEQTTAKSLQLALGLVGGIVKGMSKKTAKPSSTASKGKALGRGMKTSGLKRGRG